jgi:hypothetical protein
MCQDRNDYDSHQIGYTCYNEVLNDVNYQPSEISLRKII